MSNNFKQWNPGALSQEDDAAYAVDAMRTGGAVSGIFSKELANKLFYQVTTMVAAFGEALSNKGYHPSDADLATLITLLSNVLTKADFGSAAGTACEGNDPRLTPAPAVIPPATKMWFYQNVAPSGWVLDATPADALLAVRGGSGDYSGNGGTQAGTWTQPNHLHTTGDHKLTILEMPAHTHTYSTNVSDRGGEGHPRPFAYNRMTLNSGSTGGDQVHNHGNTGNSATTATWRPLAQLGIICTKS